jgi:endoglucanase
MRVKNFFLATLLLCALQANAQKFVSVKGTEIIDPDGKPLLLKGINTGNWLVPEGYMFKFRDVNSPRLINQMFSELLGPAATAAFWDAFLNNYITHADIKYLKSLGLNHIRLPFNYRMLTDEYYMGKSNHGYKHLDNAIEWCQKEGIYVLLDMHCAPGGQTGDNIDDSYGYPWLYESEADQQLFIKIWVDIAKRYANNTTVIGYDLINEPIAHFFKNKDTLNLLLEPLFIKITKAIREVDKNHLLFIGGAQWNTNFKVFGPPFDNKLVYTFHKYWTKPDVEVIQDYIDYSKKYNVPIYLGESGENKDGWIDTFRTVLEQHNIGWGFWTYKKMDNKSCMVTFNKPANYDRLVDYSKADRSSFAKIRNNIIAVDTVKQVLDDFILNCKFENCTPNEGYLKALGVK